MINPHSVIPEVADDAESGFFSHDRPRSFIEAPDLLPLLPTGRERSVSIEVRTAPAQKQEQPEFEDHLPGVVSTRQNRNSHAVIEPDVSNMREVVDPSFFFLTTTMDNADLSRSLALSSKSSDLTI